MLKDITIGQYIPGDTPIHNLDPRIKIIITFAFIAALLLMFWLPICSAFMIMAVGLSKIPVRYIFFQRS